MLPELSTELPGTVAGDPVKVATNDATLLYVGTDPAVVLVVDCACVEEVFAALFEGQA